MRAVKQRVQPMDWIAHNGIRGAIGALALSLLLWPGQAQAQDASSKEMFAELQQLRKQIGAIRQEALRDEAIAKENKKLQKMIGAAMKKSDPHVDDHRNRLEELRGEMRSAQAKGDQKKINGLMEEAQSLQAALQKAQAEALADDKIAHAVTRVQDMLQRKMKEIDPDVEKLIKQEQELTEKLQGNG